MRPGTRHRLRSASAPCRTRSLEHARMQRVHAWGIAGGTRVVRRATDLSAQDLTMELESGPGSHPGTSVDVH
jgi:hypothetical protein